MKTGLEVGKSPLDHSIGVNVSMYRINQSHEAKAPRSFISHLLVVTVDGPKTYDRVSAHYHSPKMPNTIAQHVKNCHAYKRSRS